MEVLAVGEIVVENQIKNNNKTSESRTVKEHSYRTIYSQAYNLGKAIMANKLFFVEPERSMKIVGIFSKNRLEWFITDWACSLFGITTVPLYDTLGKENLTYCI